jgi:hypothetical protein
MAEAFAIKAMCTEKLPPPTSSKTRRTEREDNIVRFYELAGDLTLLFLQQVSTLYFWYQVILLTFRFVNHTQTFVQLLNVKEYLEYQQAWQIPALQHFKEEMKLVLM